MSVGCVLMRGEHDDALPWPMEAGNVGHIEASHFVICREVPIFSVVTKSRS